jgi:hypothetical protein
MGRLYSLAGSMMLGLSAIPLMACNGTSVIGGGDTESSGAAGGGDAPYCPATSPLATPEELATTPRADAEAEVLAFQAAGTLVAPDDVYDRVLQDLGRIRADHPEVTGITGHATFTPDQMLVGFDDAGHAALEAHTYTDWDCLNVLYGGMLTDVFWLIPAAALHFNGRFNSPLLIKEYEKVPHVKSAEASVVGDSSSVCASIDGATYSYIFDSASGDCPAGCTDHTYFGFSTTPDGSITSLGTFTKGHGAPPAWFSSREACTKQL